MKKLLLILFCLSFLGCAKSVEIPTRNQPQSPTPPTPDNKPPQPTPPNLDGFWQTGCSFDVDSQFQIKGNKITKTLRWDLIDCTFIPRSKRDRMEGTFEFGPSVKPGVWPIIATYENKKEVYEYNKKKITWVYETPRASAFFYYIRPGDEPEQEPLPPPRRGCGYEGNLEQRVQDCAKDLKDAKGLKWSLATRYNSYRVWFENSTNTLWTAIFLASQRSARSICRSGQINEVTGGNVAKWKVASAEDYKHLKEVDSLYEILGIKDTIGNGWGQTFWTDQESEMFNVATQKKEGNHPSNAMPVLCKASL